MDSVKETIKKVTEDYMANSNSLHKLGTDAKKLEVAAINQITDLLKLPNHEVIFTSSRLESNNLAILGFARQHLNKTEIIAFKHLDSSIIEPLKELEKKGYKVYYINKEEEIKKYLNKRTLLICFDKIPSQALANDVPCLLDATNTKEELKKDLSNIDFLTISFEEENFTEIAVLLKKKAIVIEPLLHGGKSTTLYRSGTPVLPFIVAFAKMLRLWYKK